MTFSIIGTGNIAWFFGKRIAAAGHSCVGVYGRNTEEVSVLADALLSKRHGTVNEIRDGDADVCFLAVSDLAIAPIAAGISFKQTILVHMAGALTLDVISGAAADYAILWPVYSIVKNNTPGHRGIPCAWEVSSDRAKRFVLEMGHAITDHLFEAGSDQRKWLHLSAVMTNNFINHLLAINEKICADNKLPGNTLQPLIAQTFDRVKNASPFAVQTGPAIRNDNNTIGQHLGLLAGQPHIHEVYEAMTNSIKELHGIK